MAVLAAVPLACGEGNRVDAGRTTAPPTSSAVVEPTTSQSLEPATSIALDPANFSDSTTIDNRWMPLVPGTQLVLEGEANRGSGLQPHRSPSPSPTSPR